MDLITYVQVHDGVPGAKDAFVTAFQEIFREPPYNEQHTDRHIATAVWRPHVADGVVIHAYAGQTIVGFGCASSLTSRQLLGVRSFLSQSGFPGNVASTWYMSELGVLRAFRGRGIGATLVLKRLEYIESRGATHYCMQTAREGSHSEPLYRKIGAQEMGIDSDTDTRHFAGVCEQAIRVLKGEQ